MKNNALKRWASLLVSNTYALYLISRDVRTPFLAKVFIGLIVAYALSPIDLIPDFIPVIGLLDDLILLSIGIWLVIKLLPDELWSEYQKLATKQLHEMPPSPLAVAIIIFIWLLAIAGFILWLF